MKQKSKGGLSIYKVYKKIIQIELDELRHSIEEIALFFETKILETESNYQFALKEVNPEEKDDILDLFDDDFYNYGKVLPSKYYNPILLSLFGSFEYWLKRICTLDAKRTFSKIKISDLTGNNYIEKSRKYLVTVLEIDLEDSELIWQKIRQIQKLRNAIAHNESNLWTDQSCNIEKQELYDFVSKDDRIDFNRSNGDFYIKKKDFLVEVIQLIGEYLNSIIDKIDQPKVIAKNTTMPYNNEGWGKEKMESLIKASIICLNLIDKFEKRTDVHRESDFKANLSVEIGDILWDATKIYSFFCDADWDVEDRDLIMKNRENGFDQIKRKYKE